MFKSLRHLNIPLDELTPYAYEDPAKKVSDATDPLIGFMRSYHRNSYLVLGHLYLSNDVPGLNKLAKSYYNKLCKWVKGNWNKYGDFYISNNAQVALRMELNR